MAPDLTSTGYSVLDFGFSTGGWAPIPDTVLLSAYSGAYELFDYTPVFHASLAAQRQTNALLWQIAFLFIAWTVAALALVSFKGYNHFIGYHGSAKK